MKKLFALLLLCLCGTAWGQQQQVNCKAIPFTTSPTACNTVSNPGTGWQGDPLWLAFGKINSNENLLFLGAGSAGVNALAYGCDPTGVNDSTACITSAGAAGKPIVFPAGQFKISGNIPVPCGGIIGAGQYQTLFLVTDTGSSSTFIYSCTLAGTFRDFSIQPQTSKSSGYAIVVQPSSGEVSGMRFQNLIFNGMPSGINFVAASLWSLQTSNFYNCTGDCVTVNNTNNPDSGDSSISQIVINNATSTSANGVHQVSSGGLKIVASKFNNGGVGYLLDMNSAGSTSDLILVGNSFENAHFSGIQLQRASGSNIFTHVVISGNQFLTSSTSGTSAAIFSNNGSNFLSRVIVNGNVIFDTDTGASSAIVFDYVNQLFVDGNTIVGAGGGSTGINFGTHNTLASIGLNTVSGFGTQISSSPGSGTGLSTVTQTWTGTQSFQAISSTGATINASGTGMTVNAAAGLLGIAVNGVGSDAARIGLTDGNAGNRTYQTRVGGVGTGIYDIFDATAAASRLQIGTNGTVTIPVSSGNVSLSIPGSGGSLSMTAGNPIGLPTYTVGTLPVCNASLKGGIAYVTDATAPTYNAALVGAGTVIVPVFCSGTAWTSH